VVAGLRLTGAVGAALLADPLALGVYELAGTGLAETLDMLMSVAGLFVFPGPA